MEATLRRTMMSVTDTIFPVSKSAKDPQKHQMLKAGILYCIIFMAVLHRNVTRMTDFSCRFESAGLVLKLKVHFCIKTNSCMGNCYAKLF